MVPFADVLQAGTVAAIVPSATRAIGSGAVFSRIARIAVVPLRCDAVTCMGDMVVLYQAEPYSV